jgi:hypothetical protein
VNRTIQSCQAGDHEGLREARPPKRKEEYVPLEKIDEVCDEILNAGTHLASVSRVDFPDAESVSNAIARVSDVVKQYELVGKWVRSVTKDIHDVNTFLFFIIHQCKA